MRIRIGLLIVGLFVSAAASPPTSVTTSRVIVRLADRGGVRAALLASVRNEPSMRVRHQRTIEGLRAIHAASLRAATPVIERARVAGALTEIGRLWSVNAIVAEVDDDWIETLEADPAIVAVIPDRRLTLGVGDGFAAASHKPVAGVPEDALIQVRVPEVWDAGITGLGAVVANVDSGVNGDDETLRDRWRGRFVGTDASWFAPVALSVFPLDDFSIGSGHGTATMGLMTGGEASFGVAFDATWIAGDAFEGGEGFVSQAVTLFEWLSDPDGDPSTTSDVPDVVNNSYGIENPEVCDGIFDQAIDALEASGAIVIWSVGNLGNQGPTTPASRADSPVNAFAVGSVDEQNVVVASSGRGPSACGNAIKPEVVAPGDRVISRNLFNGFQTVSGTSFATPIVAGVLALMRSKDPNLSPEEAKTILLETATDLVVPGDDNDSGRGIVNAAAALARVSRPTTPVARLIGFREPAGSASKLTPAGIEDALTARPGGSLSLVPMLSNHGASIPASTAVLSSPTPGVTVTRASVPMAAATPGAEIEPADASTFGVEIAGSVPLGSDIVLDLTLQGAGVAPMRAVLKAGDPAPGTFVSHDLGQVRLTVTNFGGFGFYTGIHGSGFQLRGDGFRFPPTSPNWLFHAGLMVGVGGSRLSDGVPYGEDTQNATDWIPLPGTAISTELVDGAQRIRAEYDDRRALDPLGLRVRQETFTFGEPGDDSFVVLQFAITNTTQQTIGGMRMGLFADWDLPDTNGDPGETAGWNAGRRLGFVEGSDVSQPALGVVALDDVPLGQVSYATLTHADVVASNLGTPHTGLDPAAAPELFGGEFSDAEKWEALSSGQSRTTINTGQDVYQIIGVGPRTLGAGATDTFAVALVAAPDRNQLDVVAEAARTAYFDRILGIDPPGPPPPSESVRLEQNFPNPFRIGQQTTIPYSIPAGVGGMRAEVAVFDLLGRRVRTLVDGEVIPGDQATTWDGRADTGVGAPSGVYVVRLAVDGLERSIRVLLVR